MTEMEKKPNRRALGLAAGTMALVGLISGTAGASPPSPVLPVGGFVSVRPREPRRAAPAILEDAGAITDPSTSLRPSVTRPVVQVPAAPVVVGTAPASVRPAGHSISGLASYYCTPTAPICHHDYPVGSMVAAACGKLRVAMGSSWRGRVVTVRTATRSVVVTIVDWCGSPTKTIDLYGAPFTKLAPLSAGVVKVTVSW